MTCCDVAVYRQEVRYIRDTEWGRERSLEGHHTKEKVYQIQIHLFGQIERGQQTTVLVVSLANQFKLNGSAMMKF